MLSGIGQRGAALHDGLHIFGGELDHHQKGVHILVCNQHPGVLVSELFDVGRPAVQAVVIAEHSGAAARFLRAALALHGDKVGRRIGVLPNSAVRVEVRRARQESGYRVGRNGLDLVIAVNTVEVVEQRGLNVHELCRVVGGVARLSLVCGDVESAVCISVAVTTPPACERISGIEVVDDRLRAGADVCYHAYAVVDTLSGARACIRGPAHTVDSDVFLLFQRFYAGIEAFELRLSGKARRVDFDRNLGNAVHHGVEVVGRHVGDGCALRANPLGVIGKSGVGVEDFATVRVLCENADFLDEKAGRHANARNSHDDFGLAVLRVV